MKEYLPPKADPNDRGCPSFTSPMGEGIDAPLPQENVWIPQNLSGRVHPIVVVPGYSGCALDVTYQGEKYREFDGERLWLHHNFISPFRSREYVDSFYDLLSLKSRVEDGELHYSPHIEGAKVTPTEYMASGPSGGIHSCDYILKLGGMGIVGYMAKLFDSLEKLGYSRNVNLHATSYDWRISPDYLEKFTDFSEKMKSLMEGTYRRNGEKSVILIAHSMGNLYLTRFLNRQSIEWKNKYIKHFYSVAPPWAGAPKTIRDILSGDEISQNFFASLFKIFDKKRVRKLAQNFGSLLFLNPSPSIWGDFPFVSFEDGQTFTGNQLYELYKETCSEDSSRIYSCVKDLIGEIRPPSVDLTCSFGVGLSTERSWIYESSKDTEWPKQPLCGDGDGTVSVESLRVAEYWSKNLEFNGEKSVTVKTFRGKKHLGIISDPEFLRDLSFRIYELHK